MLSDVFDTMGTAFGLDTEAELLDDEGNIPHFESIPYEAATPALVVVGFFMMTQIRHIDFNDYSIGIPAFLTIAIMPFTYSITNGIGAGFVSWLVIYFAVYPLEVVLGLK